MNALKEESQTSVTLEFWMHCTRKALVKKLDDLSQAVVNLGIKPGSKAYCLYNPNTKRIIVSRDVVFNEKACWNWKGDKKDEHSDSGMFSLPWGTSLDEGSGQYVISTSQEENAETEG